MLQIRYRYATDTLGNRVTSNIGFVLPICVHECTVQRAHCTLDLERYIPEP